LRSDLTEKPSPQAIQELARHNDRAWQKQATLDKRVIDMVFGDNTVAVEDTNHPDRQRRYQPERLLMQECGRATELIRSFYPHLADVGLMWTGEGTRGDSDRDQNERALNEGLDQSGNPTHDPPVTSRHWQQVVLGRSTDLMLPGHAHWWNFPHKKPGMSERQWLEMWHQWRHRAPVPMSWTVLPAEATFPPSWGALGDLALCKLTCTWWDLLDQFSDAELTEAGMAEDREEWGREVELAIYANKEWCCWALLKGGGSLKLRDGPQMLRSYHHNLGVCPIRIIPGMTSGRRLEGRYWLSILFFVLDMTESIDRLGSTAATAQKFDAFPMLKWRQQPDDEATEAGAKILYLPNGDVIPVRASDSQRGYGEEDVEPVFQPQFGDKTLNLLMLLLERAARMTGAVEILEGATGGGSEPAWAVNARQEMAKSKLSPLTAAVALGHRDAAEMLIRCVTEFDEDVPLFARQGSERGRIVLSPEKLRGYEPILTADYQVRLPVNWRAELQMMAQFIQMAQDPNAPLMISPLELMEKFQWSGQPMDTWRRWVHDSFLFHPRIREKLVEAKLDALDAAESEAAALTSEQVMALDLPEPIKQALLAGANGGAPAGGGAGTSGNGRGGGMGDLAGMVSANIPFTRAMGGPQPAESVRAL